MTAERTSEYTPTTGEVRADYVRDHTRGFDSYQAGRSLTSEQEYHGSEFDRWLARVIAEAEARMARSALLSAANEFQSLGVMGVMGPSQVAARLRARAEQVKVPRG